MATSNSSFGEFNGKLGNLVSYQLKGKTVVRHIGKTKKPPTAAQLAVRQRMATVIKFLRPALAFINTGLLEPAINPQVSLTGTLLTITWSVTADMDWGIKNDRTMLLVYCPELDKVVYVLSGARRSSGQDEMELPANYAGKELQVYISFKASNGKSISDSCWVGV